MAGFENGGRVRLARDVARLVVMTWEDFWAEALNEFDNQKGPQVPDMEKDSKDFLDAMKKAWQAGLSPEDAVRRYLLGSSIL